MTEKDILLKNTILRTIINNQPGLVWIKDLEGKFIAVNRAFANACGYDNVDDLINKTDFDVWDYDLSLKYKEDDLEVIRTGNPKIIEEKISVNGAITWFETYKSPLIDEGGIIYGTTGFAQDITKRKNYEQILLENQDRFEKLSRQTKTVVWEVDIDGVFQYVNESVEEVYGYQKNEIIGSLKFYDLFPSKNIQKNKDFIFNLINNKEVIRDFEHKIITKNGIEKWINTNGIPVKDENKNLIGYRGSDTDISEKKTTDEKLADNESYLKSIIQTTTDSFWVIDTSGKFLYVNEAFCKLTGYYAEEFKNLTIGDIDAIERFEDTLERIQRIIRNGFELFETIHKRKDGKLIPIEVSSTFLKERGGQFVCFGRDLSDKKKAQELIDQTKQNYEAFFNTIDEFLFVLDHKGDIIHTNQTVTDRLGFTREELIGKSVLSVHPENRRYEAAQIVFDMLEGKAEFCPVPLITKSGSQIPVETRVTKGFWNGMPVIFGVTKDISKLRLSEEKFSKVFYLNPAACGLSDLETGVYLEVNDAFIRMFGFSKDEVINKTAMELGILRGEERVKLLNYADESGSILNADVILFDKNSDPKHVIISAENILLQDRTLRYTVVYDITQIKNAENKLKEKNAELESQYEEYVSLNDELTRTNYYLSEAKKIVEESEANLRAIIENTTDSIWSLNTNFNLIYINENFRNEFKQSFGVDLKIGDNVLECLPEILQPVWQDRYNKVFSGEQFSIEDKIPLAENTFLYIQVSLNPIIVNDKVIGASFFGRNVTEKRLIEEEIRQSNERLQSIFRVAPAGIGIVRNRIISEANPFLCAMLGYSKEELIGKSSRIFYKTDKEFENVGKEKYRQIDESGTGIVETTWVTKNGELLNIILASTPLDLSDYSKGVTFTSLDITEQKYAQKKLFRYNQMLESFLEISRTITMTNDYSKVMQMIVDNAVSSINIGSGAIYLLNESDELILYSTTPPLPEDFPEEGRSARLSDHPHIEKAIKTGNYVIIKDTSKEDLSEEEFKIVQMRDLKSNIYLPILLRDQPIGVLILSSINEKFNFDVEIIGLLQGFTHQTAQIINNIQNFEDLKKYARQLEIAKDKAEKSEKKLKQSQDIAKLGGWELDQITGMFTFNDNFYNLFHTSIDEIGSYQVSIEDYGSKFIYHEDRHLLAFENEKALQTKDNDFTNYLEHRIKYFDGGIGYIEVRYFVIKDELGNTIKTYGVNQDITEKKLAEKALLNSQMRFDLAMAASKDGIFDWNLVTNEIYYSPGWKIMLGYNDDELPNDFSVWEKLTQPEDVQKSWQMQKELINKQRDRFEIEFKMMHKNGHWVDILARAEAIFDQNDKAVRIVGTHVDISERKRTEAAILHEKQFSDMLIESLPGIFYMFDSNFKPLRWNSNKAQFLGLTNEEMKIHNTLDYIADKDKQKIIESFKNTFIHGESQVIVNIKRHDGIEFAYHLTGKRLDTANGPLLIGVGIDVTEREKAESELKDALLKAEESDRLKTAFLQNMSHEIRTPLNGILGFSRLLNNPNINRDNIQDYTKIISTSANRLLEIVNNVLDISKIETGQMVINNKYFSINSLISDLYLFFNNSIFDKKVTLSCQTPLENEFSFIYSDESKINQIMTNLINNAIKFTPSGKIDFGYSIKNHEAEFYVKDTGVGISREKQSQIFKRFIQGDTSISRGYEGAGLGLAICKGLVEILDGKIWVESELSKGSVFYFTIPLTKNQNKHNNEDTKMENNMTESKKNALIVEDDAVSMKYLEKVLTDNNFNIFSAVSGIDAIEIFKNNKNIDIVLLDIKMPGMDGFEVCREIKKLNSAVPVIAQTAFGFQHEKEIIIASGFDDYISKPIDYNILMRIMKKYIKIE